MRKFLPALRGLTTTAIEPSAVLVPEEVESKTLSVAGYASTTTVGGLSSSVTDRAAGWDMDQVITEGYERVVWVYRCVELMAGHASRLPFTIGKNLGEDDEERMDQHPLYRVLNKQANPHETGRAFRKRLAAQLLLSKRGVFVEVGKSRAGTITRLDLLDPGRVTPIADPHGDYIAHFEFIRRDGEVREIDPERIRWIREPHPTDPFSGVTPLEAAGMSVQLDFLSRLYNVSFIQNDSRPGGILGVDADGLSDQEMDRLERKMKPGAMNAGQVTVMGTGPGGMNYIDTTTKPRDMSYGEASTNAKNEVLSAFGIGESVLGNASGRTFDNAEAELYGFWTQPMPPFLELIAGAFDRDIDDEWDCFFDTSKIEALELPRRRDRAEALKEYQAGLRSIDEYRQQAGLRPVGTPQSRALWVLPSKAPIPTEPGDAAALGVDTATGGAPVDPNAPVGPDGAPLGPGAAPAAPGAGDAAAAVQAARGGDAAAAVAQAADAMPAEGDAAAAVTAARVGDAGAPVAADAAEAVAEARDAAAATEAPSSDGTRAVEEARLEGKALPAADDTPVEHDPGPALAAQAEMTVAAALEALLARQQGVIVARVESPKARKGTRFWQTDGKADTRGGDAELDTARITDADRWQQEAVDTLTPIVEQASSTAAVELLSAFSAGGVLAGPDLTDAELADIANRAAGFTALFTVAVAAKAMRDFVSDLAEVLRVESLIAPSTAELVTAIRGYYGDKAHHFATSLATTVAHAAVNGSRDASAATLTPLPGPQGVEVAVVRTWRTQRDTRVRPAHAETEGKSLPVGQPFQMGDAQVMYPGDPTAPPSLTRGCRCHCSYRVARNARLITPPIPGATP